MHSTADHAAFQSLSRHRSISQVFYDLVAWHTHTKWMVQFVVSFIPSGITILYIENVPTEFESKSDETIASLNMIFRWHTNVVDGVFVPRDCVYSSHFNICVCLLAATTPYANAHTAWPHTHTHTRSFNSNCLAKTDSV